MIRARHKYFRAVPLAQDLGEPCCGSFREPYREPFREPYREPYGEPCREQLAKYHPVPWLR